MGKKKNENDVDLPTKVATIALTFAAGWIAQKAVGQVWKRATGNDAPTNTDDPEIGIAQAVAFAAVSGAAMVLARRLAAQQAGKLTQRYMGKKVDPEIVD
ncbi:uncharacterized protein DUF4235 [Sediminihabitans luteus]|uniref:Uncharacterized protein DUF4235 n=1 Tax=Sediminihabitans luteus TaxID=1138585 RepID=A0A2M9CEZ7_9CELL|nr:DUF4235 domain-containing protein [Sediminihabitans luteus]PJJ70458.1 uncharacterized protein DUF4235 [Sediminihabitans luteus]GII97931.1 hypothetical protein Slu03_03090 [Sediminihabitans luteus]